MEQPPIVSQVTNIVGVHGPDVPETGPDSGESPSSSGSSTTSKPLRYYKKFSQLEAGKQYKFFNRDLMDTSIINNLPFNSYVGTVNEFNIEPKLYTGSYHYTSNQVYKSSGVRGDYFSGYIISGKLAKKHADKSIVNTINDDEIYAYGKCYSSMYNSSGYYLLLFRVYGIRPLTSYISSAFTRKTGGKRKRRTHRKRRSNRRRRS